MKITILLSRMNEIGTKRLLFIMLVAFMSIGATAQGARKKFAPERFQAELEQYIVKKACLTPKEASEFFPVYREMRNKQRMVHKEMRRMKRVKPVTDAECEKCIKKCDEFEIEIKEIQKSYHDKFMLMLPAKKVYDILNAEDRFHRQMFKRTANRNRKNK